MPAGISPAIAFLFALLMNADRQAPPSSGSQEVKSEAIGLRLTIPGGWKAKENINKWLFPSQLVIQSNPDSEHDWVLSIESNVLPKSKTAITPEDRKAWDTPPKGFRHVRSRDMRVGGYPAYEVLTQLDPWPPDRKIYVLTSEVNRLFKFNFSESSEELSAALEKVLQSFAPYGRPRAEEVETAELGARQTPEEKRAATNVYVIVTVEMMCKAILGKYVSVEQMRKGCTSGGMEFGLAEENDPAKDPNYDYRLTLRDNGYELSATPRKSGWGGYFSDGKKIYYSPTGTASSRDKALVEVPELPAAAGPAKPAPTEAAPAAPAATSAATKKRKVWTEEDIGQLRGPVSVSGGQTPPAGPETRTPRTGEFAPAQGQYKPQEELALKYMCGFYFLEHYTCKQSLNRFCSLEELAKGVQDEKGKTQGFKDDPRSDPNYEYRLALHDEAFEVWAVPRRAGLGGFYEKGSEVRYNPKGPASSADPLVKGGLSCIGVTR